MRLVDFAIGVLAAVTILAILTALVAIEGGTVYVP